MFSALGISGQRWKASVQRIAQAAETASFIGMNKKSYKYAGNPPQIQPHSDWIITVDPPSFTVFWLRDQNTRRSRQLDSAEDWSPEAVSQAVYLYICRAGIMAHTKTLNISNIAYKLLFRNFQNESKSYRSINVQIFYLFMNFACLCIILIYIFTIFNSLVVWL